MTIKQHLCEALYDATALRDGSFGRGVDPVQSREQRELVDNLIEDLQEALRLLEPSGRLSGPIKITHIIETCGGCPSQWSGKTEDDVIFYARYRHGGLTVDLGDKRVYAEEFLSEYGGDGVLSFEELSQHIGHLFDFTDVKWVEKKEDLGFGRW